MVTIKRIIIVILCAAILTTLSGCGSWIRRNPLSEQKKSERCTVTIKLVPKREDKAIVPTAVAVEAATRGLDYTIKYVQKEIKKEADRYTDKYEAYDANDQFYNNAGVFNLGSITFLREVKPDSKAIKELVKRGKITKDEKESLLRDSNHVDAMKLELVAKASKGNFFFRLEPNSLEINLAKAKLRGGMFIFGKEDDDLDIDIIITISVDWTDEKRNSHRNEFKLPPIQLRSIKLGKEIGKDNKAFQNISSYWIPMIKTSLLKEGTKGFGTYVVKIEVIEFDDFGKRVTSVAEYVEEHREDWVKKLAEQLKEKLDETKEE